MEMHIAGLDRYARPLLCALSMSLGWRIRGQFGHEMGAAIAGALGAMSIVLLSAREDWWRRAPFFAMFGALGWSAGGSMSYMKVIGYGHSSDPATVLYGFAALFLIGFLWAAFGGAGTALPAVLDGEALHKIISAVAAVLVAWFLADIAVDLSRRLGGPSFPWLSGDGGAAIIALAAATFCALFYRRFDLGISLVFHLAAGWWAGMLVLVTGLGLHLNPPRGDSWAGCVGMFAALMLFCRANRLAHLAQATLLAGILGGAGFALGQMLKFVFMSTGIILRPGVPQGGWHSILEWTHGFLFGLALAIATAALVRREPAHDHPPTHRWTGIFAVLFVLCFIPYMNFRRTPAGWIKFYEGLPEYTYGIALTSYFLPSRGWIGWLEALFVVLATGMAWLLARHMREPLPFIPESPLGRAQLLYLTFLWGITSISFAHVITQISPFILAVQWAMTMHAVLCTVFLLATSRAVPIRAPATLEPAQAVPLWRIAAFGLAAVLLVSVLGWGVKRAVFGDSFAGFFATDQIRFGPNNTNDIP